MWWVGGITGHDLIDSGSGDGDVFYREWSDRGIGVWLEWVVVVVDLDEEELGY